MKDYQYFKYNKFSPYILINQLIRLIELRFKINPQKFIEGCIDIINEQIRLHIVDGIKYTKIGESAIYEQERFLNEELLGYLNSNMVEANKSIYEHIEESLRQSESGKIKCGKEHFKELGSKLVTVSNIEDLNKKALAEAED